ncbi:hypothetical protein Pla22_47840 [Rubripirellula amarantea]|uniref:UPF0246 protein Pla22_47840 n=1 Tax=Rubripirellula amarantea TaxID=2527999 RepID=A0A5C5WGC5_9BACT|nr:peroxide stress protein YaaA [Rubripirellula amarantea]TWT49587.1 hypothetical protein Pla22_47840 [Rubripirellula amarantea]
MLSILSPAKTLDFDSPSPVSGATKPALIKDAAEIVEVLKELTPPRLAQLMSVSAKLADLNYQRYQDWEAPHPKLGSKAALFAFQGDVYRGLKASAWTKSQVAYAQDHLRILSGLYGILRPLDQILPYRLEMGTSLKTSRGKDLYAFWGTLVANQLQQQIEASQSKILLNLASQEYFKVVDRKTLQCRVVSPAFKEYKNGDYKVISIFAKLARGEMAAWVIKHKVKTLKKLTRFSEDGYRYDADRSTDEVPVFVRGGH